MRVVGIRALKGEMIMSFDYYASVCTNIDDIKNFSTNLLKVIGDYITDDEELFDIKLILNELIINSAMHGNMMDERKNISVAIHIIDNSIRIDVKDEGKGIRLPVTQKSNSCFMGGRGLGIVGALADELKTCANLITCIKYIK